MTEQNTSINIDHLKMLEYSANNDSITDDTLKNLRALIRERYLVAIAIKANPNADVLIDNYEYINKNIKLLLNIA